MAGAELAPSHHGFTAGGLRLARGRFIAAHSAGRRPTEEMRPWPRSSTGWSLHVSAGDGGNGCVSVHREKFKPLGGPDGGNGGHGGDVVLVVDPQVHTLLDFHHRPHRRAGNGGPGVGDNRSGADGDDLVLPVPDGTVVHDADGTRARRPGRRRAPRFVVAAGGRGGLGNAALASRQAQGPRLRAARRAGRERRRRPRAQDRRRRRRWSASRRAGKSSLIAAISAAQPKIADYPFTTLDPEPRCRRRPATTRFTVADVPGLIEGASEGKGLGLEFLRHVERCSVLVHVLDCATLEPGRDPISDLDVILGELAAYPVPDGAAARCSSARGSSRSTRSTCPTAGSSPSSSAPSSRRAATASSRSPRSAARACASCRSRWPSSSPRPRAAQPRRPEAAADRPAAPGGRRRRLRGPGRGRIGRARSTASSARSPSAGSRRPTSPTTRPSATSPTGSPSSASRTQLFKAGAVAGSTVVIGEGDGVVFDWEPTLTSTAELITSPRGADARLDASERPTRHQRRDDYFARMDAKAAARAELSREREAGMWTDDDGSPSTAGSRRPAAERRTTQQR